MFTICHQVGIKADPARVYQALTSAEGISEWWSRAEGDFEAGGEFKVHIDGTVMALLVLQQNPSKIAWQCVEVPAEWRDTQILFELDPRGEQVVVRFRHEMWSEETDAFAHCSTKWAAYLLSLKGLLEEGKGRPYPDDIPVNHNEKTGVT